MIEILILESVIVSGVTINKMLPFVIVIRLFPTDLLIYVRYDNNNIFEFNINIFYKVKFLQYKFEITENNFI
jgi:hypothetical protein